MTTNTKNVVEDATVSPNVGDTLYYDGYNWVRLAAGSTGQVLQSSGSNAPPTWISPSTIEQVVYSIDFSTLSNQTFTVNSNTLAGGSTVSIGGQNWYLMAGQNGLPTTCAIVNGTGLVCNGGSAGQAAFFTKRLTDFGSNCLIGINGISIEAEISVAGGYTSTLTEIGFSGYPGIGSYDTLEVYDSSWSINGNGYLYSCGNTGSSSVLSRCIKGTASSTTLLSTTPMVITPNLFRVVMQAPYSANMLYSQYISGYPATSQYYFQGATQTGDINTSGVINPNDWTIWIHSGLGPSGSGTNLNSATIKKLRILSF